MKDTQQFVKWADQQEQIRRRILDAIDTRPAGTKHEVVSILNRVAVLEAWHKPPFDDARFTVAVRKGHSASWRAYSYYTATAEAAMLNGIAYLNEGANSRAGEYAARILGCDK